MASKSLLPFTFVPKWTCPRCRFQSKASLQRSLLQPSHQQKRALSSALGRGDELELRAAPEIDFDEDAMLRRPARIIPASSSYFTTIPVFNDHILRLQRFIKDTASLPTVKPENAPRISWMTLEQVRSFTGEKVGAAKYSQVLKLLRRLNLIHAKYKTKMISEYLEQFRRPGSAQSALPRPSFIDEFGRSSAVGRRKASVAKVSLVEGTGEVLINGKSIVQAFPRIHDRESALWPLKITGRIDKYNIFALTHGGGLTGQAESITLAMAKALIVHEPALKPILRKAGCVTRIMKRVERKKAGRVKARKRPTWVKR